MAVSAHDQRFRNTPGRHLKQRGVIAGPTMPTVQFLLGLFDHSRAFLPSCNMQGVMAVKHGIYIIHFLSHGLLESDPGNSSSRETHSGELLPSPQQKDRGGGMGWKYS